MQSRAGVAVQPYTDISPDELNAMLANKDFLLVNTHIPFEGDLPQTDLSIPYNEIGANLQLLPAHKDAKIVLYCRSDRIAGLLRKNCPGWVIPTSTTWLAALQPGRRPAIPWRLPQ